MSKIFFSIVGIFIILAAGGSTIVSPNVPPKSPFVQDPKELLSAPTSVKLGKIFPAAEIIYRQEGHIYTMDSNGGHVTQMTFGEPRDCEHVAASHDHRYIVANVHDGPISFLWLYDLEQSTEARLLPNFYDAGDGGVDWDPKGFIYFVGKETSSQRFRDLYKVKFDGTGLMRLTNTPGTQECDPSVSEDGSLVNYCLSVPEPSRNSVHTEIWVINSDGTNPRQVYIGGDVLKSSVHDPELSPDNKKSIFSQVNSTVPPNYPNNQPLNTAHDIWSIDLDGTGLVRRTKPGPISIVPDWQGEAIVYTHISEREGRAGAAIISADGSQDQSPRFIKPGADAAKWIPHGK